MPTTLPPPGDPKALYVMDLSGYVFRAYHGVRPLSNSKGEPTHATLGVTNMIMSLVRSQRPTYLAVAMDSKTRTFRHDTYPAYKANRPPPPPDLKQQMDRCREVAEAYAIPVLQQDGFEADDLIATSIEHARKHGLNVVVCSGDKDLLQLVDRDVIVWDAMHSRVFGPDEVKEKWGVGPDRVCDLLALMGDSSDNVPGVEHVGEKTAAKLLSEHASLDGIYQNLDKIKGKTKEYLSLHEADARLSYKLVCLKRDVPMTFDLEALRYGGWDKPKLKTLFLQLEFNKLADALEAAPAVVSGVEKPPTYETVLTVQHLDTVIAACRANKWFALRAELAAPDLPQSSDLVGVALAWKARAGVYIPIAHRVMTDPKQLSRETVYARLAPLFADAAVHKVAQDVKREALAFQRAGIPVAGFDFDTMIASYLIDPERHQHRLEEIARTELGLELRTYDQLLKPAKGKQITFDELEIATATPHAAQAADVVVRAAEKLRPRIESEGLWELMRDVEIPLARVLAEMEERGVHLDVGRLKKLAARVAGEVEKLEKEAHTIVGKSFNINAPRQLETILFDELKLPVLKRTKTARSTDAEVLEELAEKHSLPAKILEVRSLTKLQGTYLEALPALVDKHSRVHTSYNQAVAATGRLSSSNPNLQNIPVRTPIGKEIRAAFTAPEGHFILSADYSQIELRVLAHLSHDPILVDAFQRNEDVHSRTAMEIFKVAAKDVTKEMRARAKTTNFAVIYGQGESALGRQLGISRDEATEFIRAYFTTFATLRKYMDDVIERAKAGEGVRTLLGRRRFLPDLHSSNRALRLAAERMATNTPIQGTSADIIKLAMVAVDRALSAKKLASRMVLTVHDELVFEVPDAEREVMGVLVKETMQDVMKLSVPLVVECGWGRDWGEAH